MPIIRLLLSILATTYALPCPAWSFYHPAQPTKPFVLMIDIPAESHHRTRAVGDIFETTLCNTIASQLKKRINERAPFVKVLFNQASGPSKSPFYSASIANKLNVDLVISLAAFERHEVIPSITLYQFDYKSESKPSKQLRFYSIDTIYTISEATTSSWISHLEHQLRAQENITIASYRLPYKPLIGMKAPAIGIEIGWTASTDYSTISTSLAESLYAIVTQTL